MSDSSRLDALELAVARLTKELVALRAEVRVSRGSEREDTSVADTSLRADESVVAATRVAADAVPSTPSESTPRRAPYVSDELRRIAAAGATAGASAHATSDSSAGAAGGGARAGSGERDARDAAGTVPPAAAWRPQPSRFQRENLEALVGRYGTLALAAFTILMGVGAFIGWAIKNGLIGPEMRVALGAVVAGVVAMVGLRLRRGDSPRFGSVLLALALAILHVVCWGAGPLLHLVPGALALAVAAAASAGLSILALREEDQSLFNVGFGGALLAPFVTSSNTGDPVLLLLYGALVLAAGMRAMGDRAWSKTPFVLGTGVAAYTAAASGQLGGAEPWVRASAPGIFAIAVAWLSIILVKGKARERVAITALITAVGAIANMLESQTLLPVRQPLAALVAITGFLTVSGQSAGRFVGFLVGLAIPVGSLLATVSNLSFSRASGGVTLMWAVGSAAAAWANRDGARKWHAFTATALGGAAIALLLRNQDRATVIALAAYAAAASVVVRRFSLKDVALAAIGWLSIATVIAFALLDDRERWLTRPFLTPESGVALIVCTAWLVFAWNWARVGMEEGEVMFDTRRSVARILGGVVTFLWIHVELARTVSIDVSTFLLVAYYAASGVLAIGVGRWRGIPLLRQVGLALAVFAAFKAMMETSSLSIGWRVGGYMLAGVFLLGVAYWYRGKGDSSAPADETLTPEGAPAP